jgi:hypothetical protein
MLAKRELIDTGTNKLFPRRNAAPRSPRLLTSGSLYQGAPSLCPLRFRLALHTRRIYCRVEASGACRLLRKQSMQLALPTMGAGMGTDAKALGYFVDAVAHCQSLKDGFRHVMLAPLAWQIDDDEVHRHGWVAQLCDGRRISRIPRGQEARGSRKPQQPTLRPLDHPDQLRPSLPDPAVHWFEPSHVNVALGRDTLRAGDPTPLVRRVANGRQCCFERSI